MPFCQNCGTAAEGLNCPKCGAPLAAAAGAGAAPPAAAASGEGLADNIVGLLCYLVGVICPILFLVLEPYNKKKFVKFHAFQSLFLTAAWIGLCIALTILAMIITHIPILGAIIMLLLWVVIGFGGFALWIMLLVKAYQGQMWQLPVIGPLADKQSGV